MKDRPLEIVHTFAGFDFPRYVYQLPKGKPADRKGKEKCTGSYYHDPGTVPSQRMSFYLASDFHPGLRWEYADQVEGAHIEHQGWYTDELCDQTIRGLVLRLNRGRGFLAGWTMGENMASALDRQIWDEATDAAREADRWAERAAEEEREYQAKERAREEMEENRIAILENRTARRRLIAELREARGMRLQFPAICRSIFADIRRLKNENQTSHEKIEELTREFAL